MADKVILLVVAILGLAGVATAAWGMCQPTYPIPPTSFDPTQEPVFRPLPHRPKG